MQYVTQVFSVKINGNTPILNFGLDKIASKFFFNFKNFVTIIIYANRIDLLLIELWRLDHLTMTDGILIYKTEQNVLKSQQDFQKLVHNAIAQVLSVNKSHLACS